MWFSPSGSPGTLVFCYQLSYPSSSAKLDVPRTEHVTIGGRAFSSTAAQIWNSLPRAVQSSESLDFFRRRLKTELFERSYNWYRACQTTLLLRDSLSLSRSFLLWLQPWSLSTIMLLWHSFLIIIIIIIIIPRSHGTPCEGFRQDWVDKTAKKQNFYQ